MPVIALRIYSNSGNGVFLRHPNQKGQGVGIGNGGGVDSVCRSLNVGLHSMNPG